MLCFLIHLHIQISKVSQTTRHHHEQKHTPKLDSLTRHHRARKNKAIETKSEQNPAKPVSSRWIRIHRKNAATN